MTLWYRLGRICKQWQMAGVSSAVKNGLRIPGPHRHPILPHRNPCVIYAPVRSFAAPVQFMPKKTEDDSGPRLNDAITASHVRLVTDEGHRVVPRWEALDRAKKLDLDLVEVQRNTDPPVCKIMDFFKEKYKKETKEKERAKSKSASTLRNGESKEVRFNEKTEVKDLQMKANMVTRLMDRGYRVKCTVVPAGKVDDLLGLLSRLLALIDDIAVVESGPHMVETKQAYVIVRHVKFATKKSGKKAIKPIDAVMRAQSTVTASSSIEAEMPQDEEEREQIHCRSQNDSELSDSNKRASVSGFKSINHSNNLVHVDKRKHTEDMSRQTVPDSSRYLNREQKSPASNFGSSQSGPSIVESNRYAKNGPKGFDQRTAPARSESNARAQFVPKQPQFNPSNLGSPSPVYGKFTTRATDLSIDQNKLGVATAGKLNDPNTQPKGYGAFSSLRTAASGDHSYTSKPSSESIRNNPNSGSSSNRSYGIFSAKKPVGSGDQRSSASAEKPSNSSSITPRYGVFSTSKPSASST